MEQGVMFYNSIPENIQVLSQNTQQNVTTATKIVMEAVVE